MSLCILRCDGGRRAHNRIDTRYTAAHIGPLSSLLPSPFVVLATAVIGDERRRAVRQGSHVTAQRSAAQGNAKPRNVIAS